jgi:predicted RNA-binding protein with TRAM domain
MEIEDIGEQGDGIARVERGYVVIVPEAETSEEVIIEITKIQENAAFAEVVVGLNQ